MPSGSTTTTTDLAQLPSVTFSDDATPVWQDSNSFGSSDAFATSVVKVVSEGPPEMSGQSSASAPSTTPPYQQSSGNTYVADRRINPFAGPAPDPPGTYPVRQVVAVDEACVHSPDGTFKKTHTLGDVTFRNSNPQVAKVKRVYVDGKFQDVHTDPAAASLPLSADSKFQKFTPNPNMFTKGGGFYRPPNTTQPPLRVQESVLKELHEESQLRRQDVSDVNPTAHIQVNPPDTAKTPIYVHPPVQPIHVHPPVQPVHVHPPVQPIHVHPPVQPVHVHSPVQPVHVHPPVRPVHVPPPDSAGMGGAEAAVDHPYGNKEVEFSDSSASTPIFGAKDESASSVASSQSIMSLKDIIDEKPCSLNKSHSMDSANFAPNPSLKPMKQKSEGHALADTSFSLYSNSYSTSSGSSLQSFRADGCRSNARVTEHKDLSVPVFPKSESVWDSKVADADLTDEGAVEATHTTPIMKQTEFGAKPLGIITGRNLFLKPPQPPPANTSQVEKTTPRVEQPTNAAELAAKDPQSFSFPAPFPGPAPDPSPGSFPAPFPGPAPGPSPNSFPGPPPPPPPGPLPAAKERRVRPGGADYRFYCPFHEGAPNNSGCVVPETKGPIYDTAPLSSLRSSLKSPDAEPYWPFAAPPADITILGGRNPGCLFRLYRHSLIPCLGEIAQELRSSQIVSQANLSAKSAVEVMTRLFPRPVFEALKFFVQYIMLFESFTSFKALSDYEHREDLLNRIDPELQDPVDSECIAVPAHISADVSRMMLDRLVASEVVLQEWAASFGVVRSFGQDIQSRQIIIISLARVCDLLESGIAPQYDSPVSPALDHMWRSAPILTSGGEQAFFDLLCHWYNVAHENFPRDDIIYNHIFQETETDQTHLVACDLCTRNSSAESGRRACVGGCVRLVLDASDFSMGDAMQHSNEISKVLGRITKLFPFGTCPHVPFVVRSADSHNGEAMVRLLESYFAIHGVVNTLCFLDLVVCDADRRRESCSAIRSLNSIIPKDQLERCLGGAQPDCQSFQRVTLCCPPESSPCCLSAGENPWADRFRPQEFITFRHGADVPILHVLTDLVPPELARFKPRKESVRSNHVRRIFGTGRFKSRERKRLANLLIYAIQHGVNFKRTMFEDQRELLRCLQDSNWQNELCISNAIEHLELMRINLPIPLGSELREDLKLGILYFFGRDLHSRPILILRPNNEQYTLPSPERLSILVLFWMEYFERYFVLPGKVEQVRVLIDFQNMSTFWALGKMGAATKTVKLLLKLYPERLAAITVLNASFFAKNLLSITSLINGDKVTMLGANMLKALREVIHPSQLEKKYGGRAPDVDSVPSGPGEVFVPRMPALTSSRKQTLVI